MPILVDFPWAKYDDGTLVIQMSPPTAVGGWDVRFRVTKRFGATSGVMPDKFSASGYTGVSGVTVAESGIGVFQIALGSTDTSGLPYGAYACQFARTTSGSYTTLEEGYMILTP